MADPTSGIIDTANIYTLPALARATGWGKAGIRSARRKGLVVRYASGKAFVLGSDVAEFLRTCPCESPTAAKVTPR